MPLVRCRRLRNSALGQITTAAVLAAGLAGCAPVLRGGLPIEDLLAAHDPELRVEGHTRLYPVRGSTASAVRRSLDRRAQWASGDARYEAGTSWRFGATWSRVPGETGCVLRDPRLTVKLEITLPVWAGPTRGAEDTLALFERYSRALWTHELGHVTRALATADDVLAGLRALPMGPDCVAVDRQAAALQRSALDALELEQRVYDEASGHGASQGAQFPPPPRAPGL